MKIALIGPTYPFRGGISHYTTFLYRHLAPSHRVRLISFSRQYPQWLYPGQSDRDEHSTLRLPQAEPLLDGANPLTWWRVARQLRASRPDVLVMQWTVPYWMPLLWLLLRLAAPQTRKVMICHNATPHEQSHWWLATIRRYLQRHIMGLSDLLICHAATDEAELRTLLPHQPIRRVLLPTYADLATPHLDSDKPLVGGPHLLFFGFVRPYKGMDTLLAAMPQVLQKLPQAHLTIAGEWWSAAGDPRSLIPPSLIPHITLLNRYVTNDEVSHLFQAADVAVLPYKSATQSAVVQVAFGFNVPVITTAVGGLPEAVTHEVSGLIVPPDDPTALADAIIRYQQEGWRERLLPGVRAAREQASWSALIDAILAPL